jgi:hypothetical protein
MSNRDGWTGNTNETAGDDVEAHGIQANTNESATDDEVEAHGFTSNVNETADDDDGA